MPAPLRRPRRTPLVVLAGLLASGLVVLAPGAARAASGDLDPGWNGAGTQLTTLSGSDDAYAATVQPDDKVVVAGKAQSAGSPPRMALARYRPDGTLDPSFGSAGTVVVPPVFGAGDTNGDQANAVAVTPTGRVLVAGFASHANGDGALAVAAFDTDGALDTGFGGGTGLATVVVGPGGAYNSVNAITLLPDGKIVLAGTWENGWVVARLSADGALDPTFNPAGSPAGTRTVALGDDYADNPYAVVTVADAGSTDLVVGGTGASTPGAPGRFDQDFALVRLNADGSNDPAFGIGGVVRTDVGGDLDRIDALTVQPDGRLVAAGHGGTAGGVANLTVARYLADGSLDTTFAGDGTQTVPGAVDQNDPWSGVGLLSDGAVVAATSSDASDLMVAKLSGAGVLDTGFGGTGVVTRDVAGNDVLRSLVVDGDDRVLVAGTGASAPDTAWLTARFLTGNAPTVSTQPTPQDACDTGDAVFTASGSGDGTLRYQWQWSADAGATWQDFQAGDVGVSGQFTDTLTLSGLDADDHGTLYRAVISSGGGTVRTDPAAVTAGTSPSVTLAPADQLRSDGATARFLASASGTPAPTVQWKVDDNGDGAYDPVAGATSDSLRTRGDGG